MSLARQLAAGTLPGLLALANVSWAVSLLALSHGPHLVTFDASPSATAMVLHHHAPLAHDHEHRDVDSHHEPENGDHIVHQQHDDAGLSAKRSLPGNERPVELVRCHAVVAPTEPRAQACWLMLPVAHAASPPIRTVVLRI